MDGTSQTATVPNSHKTQVATGLTGPAQGTSLAWTRLDMLYKSLPKFADTTHPFIFTAMPAQMVRPGNINKISETEKKTKTILTILFLLSSYLKMMKFIYFEFYFKYSVVGVIHYNCCLCQALMVVDLILISFQVTNY